MGWRVLGIFAHFETGDLQNHSSNLAAGIIGFRGFPEFLKLNRGIRWPEEHSSCSAKKVLELAVAEPAVVEPAVAAVVAVVAAVVDDVRAVPSVK